LLVGGPFLGCFTPDLLFVGSGEGEQAVGYDGLKAMLERLAPRRGRHVLDRVGTRWLGNDSARSRLSRVGRVRSTGSLERFDGTAYRLTGVLVRRDGAWLWKVYHGSEPSCWTAPAGDRAIVRRGGHLARAEGGDGRSSAVLRATGDIS
jgi:hypothetical protein